MFNTLRPFIAPALAPFIAAILAYLASKFNIVYSVEQQAQISEGAVTAVLALFAMAASLSGVVKVALNKKLNPANAASTELATLGKVTNDDERRINAVAKTRDGI